jgi:hypothetical protein
MPDFGLLGSLMENLHQEFVNIYYLMLPVFFGLALILAWFRASGSAPDFLDVLKRTIVSMILLVAFPDISRAIAFIAEGITNKFRYFHADGAAKDAELFVYTDQYSTSI